MILLPVALTSSNEEDHVDESTVCGHLQEELGC